MRKYRRSPFRTSSERNIRRLVERAAEEHWAPRWLKAQLRKVFWSLAVKHRVETRRAYQLWRSAFVSVTGHGIRAIPDTRQLPLFRVAS